MAQGDPVKLEQVDGDMAAFEEDLKSVLGDMAAFEEDLKSVLEVGGGGGEGGMVVWGEGRRG